VVSPQPPGGEPRPRLEVQRRSLECVLAASTGEHAAGTPRGTGANLLSLAPHCSTVSAALWHGPALWHGLLTVPPARPQVSVSVCRRSAVVVGGVVGRPRHNTGSRPAA